eukprot:351010-Chlamydomonas_euryale.AAC.2
MHFCAQLPHARTGTPECAHVNALKPTPCVPAHEQLTVSPGFQRRQLPHSFQQFRVAVVTCVSGGPARRQPCRGAGDDVQRRGPQHGRLHFCGSTAAAAAAAAVARMQLPPLGQAVNDHAGGLPAARLLAAALAAAAAAAATSGGAAAAVRHMASACCKGHRPRPADACDQGRRKRFVARAAR